MYTMEEGKRWKDRQWSTIYYTENYI